MQKLKSFHKIREEAEEIAELSKAMSKQEAMSDDEVNKTVAPAKNTQHARDMLQKKGMKKRDAKNAVDRHIRQGISSMIKDTPKPKSIPNMSTYVSKLKK